MELSERYIRQLESEGYSQVYEGQDKPDTVYPPHVHEEKSSMCVTDGTITFEIQGEKTEVTAGNRIDIPANIEHSAVVGPEGVIYIVGEA